MISICQHQFIIGAFLEVGPIGLEQMHYITHGIAHPIKAAGYMHKKKQFDFEGM
jgi:hypothetical protein